jgi:hypothetical protein
MRHKSAQTTIVVVVLMCLAIAVGALGLVGPAGVGGVAAAGAATTATRAGSAATRAGSLPRASDVARGRFVTPVALDRGAFKVAPAPARDRPILTQARTAQKIWASSVFSGRQRGPLGYGLVTISRRVKGVLRITKLPAWIGFAQSTSAESCPAEMPGSTSTPPLSAASFPSSGYAAVVIGAATGAPAVTYIARSLVCMSAQPAVLAEASEVVSVRWRALGPVTNATLEVKATLPACGSFAGISSGGSSQSTTITIQITVPDVRAQCKGAHTTTTITQTVNFGPPDTSPNAPPPLITGTTVVKHAPLGPIPQVEPLAP